MPRVRRSPLLTAIAGLALLGALAFAAAAAAAPTLLAPVLVSTTGQDTATGVLGVAMDAGGDVTAAWGRPGGTATTISSAEHPDGGGWSAQTDASGTGLNTLFGGVGADDAGTGYAFWFQQTGPTTYVAQTSSRPRGGSWGTPQNLDAVTNNMGSIVGAVNARGDAVAVWTQPAVSVTIEVATKPAGGAWSAPTPLSTSNTNGSPTAAIDAAGDAVVAWTVVSGGARQLVSSVHPAGGTWTNITVSSGGGTDVNPPRLAMDDAGDATVLFNRGTGPAQAATHTAGAGSWSAAATLSGAATSVGGLQIAENGAGEAIAAWTDSNGVETAIRPSGSGAFGAASALAATGFTPAVAIDQAGGAIVAWADASGVNAAVRAPGGAFGSALPVGASLGTPAVGIDAAGDGVVLAQDTGAAPHGIRAAGFDANPPSVGPIAFPSTATAGTSFSYSAGSVLDVWDPAPFVAWSFGDGQIGPTAGTHTYAAAGSFTATFTATDASGNTTTVHRTISVQAASGHGGGSGGGEKPRLSHLKLTPARFRAARSGASTAKRRRAAPVGTKITYSVSLAATTRFRVLVTRRGIRSGKRCVRAPRHPRRGARRCTFTTVLGSFSHASGAGRASVRFSGRIGRHTLKPGRYTLSAVARNRSGSSRTLRVTFTIVAR